MHTLHLRRVSFMGAFKPSEDEQSAKIVNKIVIGAPWRKERILGGRFFSRWGERPDRDANADTGSNASRAAIDLRQHTPTFIRQHSRSEREPRKCELAFAIFTLKAKVCSSPLLLPSGRSPPFSLLSVAVLFFVPHAARG